MSTANPPAIFTYFGSIVSAPINAHTVMLGCLGFNYLVCAVAVTQRHPENPLGWKSHVTKTANYYLLLHGFVFCLKFIFLITQRESMKIIHFSNVVLWECFNIYKIF